jgi:4'-phosphopantetheinyl transferase
MPFIREINPAAGVRAGTWHITETEAELRSMIRLTEAGEILYASFRNEMRKKQWLACRALLGELLRPIVPEILYDLNGKPFLASGSHHISVSHAGEFAAAVFSGEVPVGIDIESLRDRIERVKERFINERERRFLNPECRLEHLYIYWCGKEALYKLYGKPGVDFRNDIHIHPFDYLCNTNRTCRATLSVEGCNREHNVYYEKLGEYMVAVAY